MTEQDTPGYAVGRSFSSGMKFHAVPHGAPSAGQPCPTRVDGYKVPYKAVCGREVALLTGSVVLDGDHVHTDNWAYQWVSWPSRRGMECRSCAAKVTAQKSSNEGNGIMTETTTAPRDVNAAFDAQRAQQLQTVSDRQAWLDGQVKSGEMRKNPNGTYTVLTGWDRGEVFQANGLPQSGLDTLANGETAFYSKDVPAWHGLGTVIPGGAKTATDVLRYAGQDFTVKLIETPHYNPVLNAWETVADNFTSYRTDTGLALGVVGKRFVPIQNRDAYSLLDELTEYMPAETAGTFDKGRRTFVTAKVPEDLILDPDGIADPISQYVNIINHHDGRGSLTAMVSAWRIRCKNTEAIATRTAQRKFAIRHTKNYSDKVQAAKEALGLVRRYYTAFAEEETALIETPFSSNGIDDLIAQVWGEMDETKETSKRGVTMAANRRDSVMKLWDMETERCGRNAYAAERAITGYVDHERPKRVGSKGITPLQALGEAILADTNAEPKQKAHKALMLLTNR